MAAKTRLDVLLVERGFMESRQKAQAVIMSGSVFVAGQRVDKPGTAVPNEADIEVRGHVLRYVSRGGLKLEKAMKSFPLTLEGKVCADIGASTGGFTDCMLQNGAVKVYSVDVGYGQLDWKLRNDAAGIGISGLFILEGYYDRYGLQDWAQARYDATPVKASACIDC